MESFFTLIDKILPLLSTLLGAYITYYVTVSSKKSELKVAAQTKARDEYWIPCSVAITTLQEKIIELTKDETCYVSFQGTDSCELETSNLLEYFRADKRLIMGYHLRIEIMGIKKFVPEIFKEIELKRHCR